MDDVGRFSQWFPLGAPAPAVAGLVQCKVVGELIRYPKGASAMVRYDSGASVAALVARAAELTATRFSPALVRWRFQAAPPDAARRLLAQLLARFEARFGALPVLGASRDA